MYVTISNWMNAPLPLPSDSHLFAIGDVHGCARELAALHQVLGEEISELGSGRCQLVHLGDYIDRGPDSLGVLEILSQDLDLGAEVVNLVGNHDQFLIELVRNPEEIDIEFMANWYENGGIQTMKSLQVTGYGRLVDAGELEELSRRVKVSLGSHLVEFLYSLEAIHRTGDYVFVHAGIDPSKTFEDQDFADLLLIREPFLSAGKAWSSPFCVVHGHSISPPAVHRHRIAVDAGCSAFGALCAVHLCRQGVRFIAVSKSESCAWLEQLGGPATDWQWSRPCPIH